MALKIDRSYIDSQTTSATDHGVIVHPSAQTLVLSRDMQAILRPLYAVLNREARQRSIDVDAIEVYPFVSIEDGDQELVVRQWVKASQEVALQYWTELSEPLRKWIKALPKDLQDKAFEQVRVSVRWNRDGHQVETKPTSAKEIIGPIFEAYTCQPHLPEFDLGSSF